MAGLRLLEEYLNREFGALPEADLERRTQDRAVDIAASAPQIRANEVLNQAPQELPDWSAPEGAEPEGNWDRTRLLGAGVMDLAESAVGIPEYVARQNKYTRGNVAPALESVRGGIADIREGILSGVSPEYLDRVGREILTLDPNKTIWQGGPIEVADAIYGKFLRSLPSTLAVMLPAARLFKAANTAGALTYLGASEGGLSVGSIQNNIADEISAMSNDELLSESRRYAEIYDEVGGDETTARQAFTAEAQGIAPLVGGVGVAAISMATGRLLKPVFSEPGLTLGRRVGMGFAEEFPQEGSQGATEQFVQNYAARLYDEDRPVSQGVGEAFAQEGLIGGLTGGAVAGAFGQRPQPPLPPPVEGEGGQLGIPGIGPRQPAPPPSQGGIPTPDEANRYMQGEAFPSALEPGRVQIPITEQGDMFERPGAMRMSDPTMAPVAPVGPSSVPGTQGDLPLTIRQRGLPHAAVPPSDGKVPDALDQPTAEPVSDIEAQIADMRSKSGRSAVYVSPSQRNLNFTLPKGAITIPNFDGKGGVLIAKNREAADYARKRRAAGGSMQAIIGELTLSGTGKPSVKSGFVVQLLNAQGAVARESLKATKKEANRLAEEWGSNTRILTGEEALARRSDLLEREQIDLRTEDSGKVSEAMNDLFDTRPQPLTAAENVSTTQGFVVQMKDEAGNLIVEEEYDTAEEANTRVDTLSEDFPDAFVTSKPQRVAARPDKMGLTAASRVRGKILKGPPEGPPPRPSREIEERRKAEDERLLKESRRDLTNPQEVEEFDPDVSVDAIEDLPDFEVTYTVISEQPQPNKSIKLVKTRETRMFSSRRAANAFAKRKYNEAVKKAGPDVSVPESTVQQVETPELEAMFQAAVQARADRKQTLVFPKDREEGKPPTADEAASDTSVLISEYRNQNREPSKKIEFIRRERASQLRRRGEVKNVRATPVTRVDRGGRLAETKTEALTYQTVSGEETVAKKIAREKKVKEANTRLRFALNRAKKFLERFENAGPYGVYVSENTNADGSVNPAGRKFLRARDAFTQLVQLAESTLISGNTSNAHVTLAKQVATSLERIKLKTMTPEQFVKEFGAVAAKTEKKMLKTVPVQFRETAAERDSKVAKLNAERARANDRRRRLEERWKNDKFFNEIIAPLFRKFAEAQQLNAEDPARNLYYTPDEFEITNVRVALRGYRKMTAAYPTDEWYTPIRKQLEYYGFEFDEAGDLIIQKFSPSENLLASGFIEKHGISKKTAGELTAPPTREDKIVLRDTAQERRDADVRDKQVAVRNIRTANALIRKFKAMVSPAKTTINGIKRQEQRLIRGLRKLGVWVDVSPGLGRMSFGGWKSKTYRLVGPRLDARTMEKAAAKDFVQSLAEIPMPRELAEIDKRMGGLEDTVESFVNENTIEMFLRAAKPQAYDADYIEAAQAIGDVLAAKGSINAQDGMLEILKAAPIDSFYYQLAEKLSTLGMKETKIEYGKSTDFGQGEMAKYRPTTNVILLNREALNESMRKGDQVYGGRVMHVLTHEATHAATHNALRNNTNLRNYFSNIRYAARDAWMKANPGKGAADAPYGLKVMSGNKVIELDEFVVEAFSNEEFQNFLKSVPVEKETLWDRVVGFVKALLGFDARVPNDLFEAVMLVEDSLYEGAGLSSERPAGDLHMEAYDSVMRGFANNFVSKFLQSSNILQRVRDGGKNTVFNLMSMEQFAERFAGRLVKEGRDLMTEYYDAFRKRNAKAAEYLDVPQKLSHRWSKLEADNPEAALAISQIGTEASLLTIDPRVGLDDDANSHLGEELHDDHMRLHTRWNELPQEAKNIFNEAVKYYTDSLQTETLFLMQSALRGMLATGESSALSQQDFDRRFSIEELRKIDTRDKLSEALAEFFEENSRRDILDTIYRMSMLPRKRKGIYMPLMRYGDEVAFAQRQRPDQIFEDRKEAMGVRKSIVGDDPTLDAQVFENDDGKFVLRVFERAFIMGESVSEVEQLKQEMIDDPNSGFTEADFFATQKRMSKKTEEAIGSNAALNSILTTLQGNEAAQAAIKNFYLRNLAEGAFRKHEVKRRNRLGVRYDLQHRNLATYAKQASYYTSQLEFGWRMAKALRDMRETTKRSREAGTRDLSLAVDHLVERDKLSHDLPTRSVLTSKSIEATHFFMLASPSYWAINASQPWMVSLPTIGARHGWMESAAQMGQFQKVLFGDLAREAASMKFGLEALKKGQRARVEETFNIIGQLEAKLRAHFGSDADAYIGLLEYLRQNHIIDINVFTEMRDVAAGKTQNAWDRTIDASRIMAHLTEVNNRVITALTAYNLELAKTNDAAKAREYAGKMVSQTQFNYSAENKPPVFQKYPLLFQFMQWPQHMYAHLIRNYQGMVKAGVMNRSEARSALLGLLGTHAAVGGITGMMLQPIKWAIGMVMMALGDDDEPYTFASAVSGRTFDRLVAEVSSDLFGTTVGSVVSKGLPMAAGIDLSARMSMGTLYFVDLRGDNAESVLGSLVASFGGATLNQGLKFANGAQKVMRGDVYAGLEQFVPKIARDALRAGRYYNEGLVNNAGDTVIPAEEMGFNDIVAQAFGFQPSKVSQFYSAQTAMKDAEQYAIGRRGDLIRRFRDAESQADRREVTRDIREFNRSNPQEAITYSALITNLRAQRTREARFRRYGANIDERKARFYEKYGEPYRDE